VTQATVLLVGADTEAGRFVLNALEGPAPSAATPGSAGADSPYRIVEADIAPPLRIVSDQGLPDLAILCGCPLDAQFKDIVASLRGVKGCEHLPLLCVGPDAAEVHSEARKAGADDFLPTSAGAEVLRNRADLLIRLKRAEDRLRAARARIRALSSEQAAILRQTQDRFQALARNATEGVAVADQDGAIQFITPAMERLLGWPDEQARGTDLWSLIHPDDLSVVRDLWAHLIESPMATATANTRVRDSKGVWRWLGVVASNQLQAPGIHGIVLNCKDIQDRRRIADALQASQARLRRVLETTQEGVWNTDERDHTTFVSDRLAMMLGYRREEMLGKPPTAFMPPEDVAAYEERIRTRAQGEIGSYEQRFVRSDGSIIWARIAATPIYDDSGGFAGAFGMLHDITKQKQADQAVRDSHARFSALIENAPLVAIQGMERDGTISLWNQACTELYGHSAGEALGATVQSLLLSPEEIPAFESALEEVWVSGRPTPTTEWQVRTKSGQTRSVISTMVPVHTDGVVSCVYCMDVDITERQAARKALLDSEEQLRRLNADLNALVEQRTAALREAIDDLDSFAFSVTHDLRAPLRAVNGFSAALVEECSNQLTGDAVRYLKYITENVELMNTLIEELLTFSRCGRQHLTMRKLDMHALVRRALQMQEPELVARCEVVIDALPVAYGDPTLIGQVLTNLLSNALKYSRTQERPRVEISAKGDVDGMVTYVVADNGVGFDMFYAEKLFAVFQRLHSAEDFEGVGVGLAIVKKIIKRHGGEVWAESEPLHGASFFFTLPREDPERHPAGAAPALDVSEERTDRDTP